MASIKGKIAPVILIAIALCVLLVGGAFAHREWLACADHLQVAQFILSLLSLVVLGWYAYDARRVAQLTQKRWERDAVLNTTYFWNLLPELESSAGRTIIGFNNPSTQIVRAKLRCNFRIYNQTVSAGGLYDGTDTWLLFPQQFRQGFVEVASLLQGKNTTIAQMKSERSEANAKIQLTAILEMEFTDELGGFRKLPQQSQYFDFVRWAWIPELAERPHNAL